MMNNGEANMSKDRMSSSGISVLALKQLTHVAKYKEFNDFQHWFGNFFDWLES